MKDEIVEIIRSPDAPNLVGKQGIIVHKEGNIVCVQVGDGFTYLNKKDVRVVKER